MRMRFSSVDINEGLLKDGLETVVGVLCEASEAGHTSPMCQKPSVSVDRWHDVATSCEVFEHHQSFHPSVEGW